MSDHLFRPQRGGTERVIRWVISDHPLITHLITLPFSSSRRPRGHAPGASATTLQFYEPQSHGPGATGPGQWFSAWSRRIRAQLLASATSPHKKGPSSAHMGAHPSGPLERTVNNYFVAGCSRYLFPSQCRLSSRHPPQSPVTAHCTFGFSAEPRGSS